jgi:hypothetical protein
MLFQAKFGGGPDEGPKEFALNVSARPGQQQCKSSAFFMNLLIFSSSDHLSA